MMKERSQNKSFAVKNDNFIYQLANKKTSFIANLEIEVDRTPFHLVARGDSAVIKFNSFSDAIGMFRKIITSPIFSDSNILAIRKLIESMGITIYLQNHHFAVFGPKAGLFFPKFIGLLSTAVKR